MLYLCLSHCLSLRYRRIILELAKAIKKYLNFSYYYHVWVMYVGTRMPQYTGESQRTTLWVFQGLNLAPKAYQQVLLPTFLPTSIPVEKHRSSKARTLSEEWKRGKAEQAERNPPRQWWRWSVENGSKANDLCPYLIPGDSRQRCCIPPCTGCQAECSCPTRAEDWEWWGTILPHPPHPGLSSEAVS